MARHVFHAPLYPFNTLLSEFGVTNTLSIATNNFTPAHGTDRVWREASTHNNPMYIIPDANLDIDVLLLTNLSVESNSVGSINNRSITTVGVEAGIYFTLTYAPSAPHAPTITTNINTIGTITKNVAPPNLDTNKVTALRLTIANGTDLKIKSWASAIDGLEAAEPATTIFEATLNSAVARRPLLMFDGDLNAKPLTFSTISVATGAGEVAPYPQAGQTITTPTTPVISNVGTTTADADWV